MSLIVVWIQFLILPVASEAFWGLGLCYQILSNLRQVWHTCIWHIKICWSECLVVKLRSILCNPSVECTVLVLVTNKMPLVSMGLIFFKRFKMAAAHFFFMWLFMTSDASKHAPKYCMMSDLGIFTLLTNNDVAVHLDICLWFPKYINSVFALLIFSCIASIQDLKLFLQSSITLMVSSLSSQLLALNNLFTTWLSANPITDRGSGISLYSVLV